jgi:putative glutamine amidotransferase
MRPIVIVPACTRDFGEHPYHAAQHKYVDAIVLGADCAPMILPSLGKDARPGNHARTVRRHHADRFGVECASQLLLRGSARPDPAPGSGARPDHAAADPRGSGAGHPDHCDLPRFPGDERGAGRQPVPGGAGWWKASSTIARTPSWAWTSNMATHTRSTDRGRHVARHPGRRRNSRQFLHGQGVNELAPGLVVEATAEDGLVEAFSVGAAPGFTLAVQWHPEWRITHNPYSMKMFGAFGEACRAYHQETEPYDPGRSDAGGWCRP